MFQFALVCKYQRTLAFTICLTVYCNGMTSLLSLVSLKVSHVRECFLATLTLHGIAK